MASKDKGPATTSMAYDAMVPEWQKIETLLSGTTAMRAAGQAYLPKHEEESNGAYTERLNCATLLNMLQMTVDAWTGKPFSEPIKIGDDVPDPIKVLLDNIDLEGNSLDVFCRNWFRNGLAKGFSHVYVDFPRTDGFSTDGGPRTLADDRAEQVRPYFLHIRPENILFANAQYTGGVEEVLMVRILEEVVEIDGWEEKCITQIRVVTPGHVKVYREYKDPRTKKVSWKIVDEYDYGLSFIPLVTFYADRKSFMEAKPPLSDLADLNIRHWQSTSDQQAVLTVARFPILGVSGAIADDKLVVGPHQWLHCPDPAGRFYYVEHSGKAIEAGRNDLLDLEETMAEYGATFLKKRPGGASATARALDTAETTSPLQDMAIRFQAAMLQALGFLGTWIGIQEVGTFSIDLDFDFGGEDKFALQTLQTARDGKDISRHRFCKELHRMRLLGEDFKQEENDKELAKEQTEQLAVEALQMKQQAKLAPKPATSPIGGPGAPGQKGGDPKSQEKKNKQIDNQGGSSGQ